MSQANSPTFTMEDLLKELSASLPTENGVEGATTAEMCQKSGWPLSRVMDRLRTGIREGKIVCSGKKRVFRIDGTPSMAPTYRVKREGE